MSANTGIEWTDSTWNPVTGCSKVSAGCDNCYAATLANRLLAAQYLARSPVVGTVANVSDPFAVRLWPERLADPERWRDSRRIFVNSMSDLFHADVPDAFVKAVFAVMVRTNRHVYQVLTKRPARLLRFWRLYHTELGVSEVPDHIWVGTSIENQEVAFRLEQLRKVPARVRFLSCEPLLGPLSLNLDHVHWVIAGGESGVMHRPLCLDWVRSIRDQCVAQGVAFFFKQVGGRTPKSHGRQLDGRTWDEYPDSAAAGHRRA
jgi:protein gp37